MGNSPFLKRDSISGPEIKPVLVWLSFATGLNSIGRTHERAQMQQSPPWLVLPDVPPLNAAKVSSVGLLISDKQAGPFRLEIDWIKAAR